MKALRLLVLIVLLMAVVPLVVLQVRAAQTGPASSTAEAPVGWSGNPLELLRQRSTVQDTFDTDGLNGLRTITVTQVIAAEDLLSSGEAMPDPSRLPLYAAARAPMLMIAHCTDVVAAVGKLCDVTRTRADLLDDGRISMEATLAYVPAAALGDPGRVSNGGLFTASVVLDDTTTQRPAFTTSNRRAAMQKAQALCDALRADLGNCVVSRLQLDTQELWITDLERLPQGTDPLRLQATVTVTVYANRAEMTEERLQDILHGLATAG
jgi:hypothetical protein